MSYLGLRFLITRINCMRNISLCNSVIQKDVFAANFHVSSRQRALLDARDPDKEEKDRQIVKKEQHFFSNVETAKRNRETFKKAVLKFNKRGDKYKRGHVEFINASMSYMEKFNAHKHLEVYKLMLDCFPKGTMIAKTVWQIEFSHYPKQQQCCIDLLDYMESHGVVPDDEMGYQLIEIFGKNTHPFRKYQRMMYWMPKFRSFNPYPIPYVLPDESLELAKMAIKRMSIDVENKIFTLNAKDSSNAVDDSWIVYGQSPQQYKLLQNHPNKKALYVEGVFNVWLRDKMLYYFVLKSEITATRLKFDKDLKEEDQYEKLFDWSHIPFFEEVDKSKIVIKPTVHEQEDGTILALCITETSSKNSLVSWINILQESNPNLKDTPVVFNFNSPESEIQLANQNKTEKDIDIVS